MARKQDKALGEAKADKQGGKPQSLSVKEEAFAQSLVRTGCQATAYRETYNVRETTKPETVWQNASRIANRTKVAARVEELRAQVAEKATEDTVITLEKVTGYVLKAIDMSIEQNDPKALSKASMDLGKLHGLVVDKSQNLNVNIDLGELLRQRIKAAKGTKTIDAV